MIDDTSFETHQDQILQLGRIIVEQHAEIERLKAEVEMMTAQAIKFRDMALSHRVLLTRAADALEGATMMVRTNSESDLIAELRKAAAE